MTAPEKQLVYESEADCRYLAANHYEVLDHEHSQTGNGSGGLATYGCKMVMSDQPAADVLGAAEKKLFTESTQYRGASRDNALHLAWLCKAVLRDSSEGYLDFSKMRMQVPMNDYETHEPLKVKSADEDLPFQAFSASSVTPLGSREEFFSATQTFCRGILDMSLFPEFVDAPDYQDGKGVHAFSPDERVLNFSLHPSVSVWWQPAISRIGYDRNMPQRVFADQLFGAETVDDPYDFTRAMLAKFVLNHAEAASASASTM